MLWSACAGVVLLGGCSGPVLRHDGTSPTGSGSFPDAYESALVLMHHGDYKAAIPVLQEFAGTHPELAGPYINLGIAYRETGDTDAAMAAVNTAIELNPDNPVAHLQRAILAREAGDFQAALAHRNLGILYDLYLQQSAKALVHYRRYLELVGNDDETVRGWVVDIERRTDSAHVSIAP
jgi:tetratricopeptide (TPR) repeat protein